MLLANNTGYALGVGEAPVFVEKGVANFEVVFFGKLQWLESTCGADLSAQSTVEFTIPGLGNKFRREHPLDAAFEKGRMQCIADTDLHAFSTSNTTLQKLVFNQSARWPDE